MRVLYPWPLLGILDPFRNSASKPLRSWIRASWCNYESNQQDANI